MKNKIISISLVMALVFSVLVTFTGCGDEDYPVEIANYIIKEEPKEIVVLDPSTADIISYIGYDVKMVGRSNEVDQDWMSVVPTVGTAANPDVEKIKASKATLVFADETLDDAVQESLEKEGITVITMAQAETQKQIETNYVSIGKILGGNVTGMNKGGQAYVDWLEELGETKDLVTQSTNSAVLNTVCYLYLEDGSLKLMTSGSYGDMLLGYTGAVNVAVNIEENSVDVKTMRVANPNYVFYADEETLNAIKADDTLKTLTAVKGGKTLMVTKEEMSRQGHSALNTLTKMMSFMYPEFIKLYATPDQVATTAPATQQQNATTATTATTASTSVAKSVASEYKIDLSNNLTLKYEDENDNVKAMQQRLFDLGYVTDAENVTGYYGDVSKEAVSAFQKKNNIKETGEADNATLVAMFSDSAVKAN